MVPGGEDSRTTPASPCSPEAATSTHPNSPGLWPPRQKECSHIRHHTSSALVHLLRRPRRRSELQFRCAKNRYPRTLARQTYHSRVVPRQPATNSAHIARSPPAPNVGRMHPAPCLALSLTAARLLPQERPARIGVERRHSEPQLSVPGAAAGAHGWHWSSCAPSHHEPATGNTGGKPASGP